MKDWVGKDIEGYGYNLWNDIYNSTATSLDAVKKAHLKAAKDDEVRKLMVEIFDDPKLHEKVMDNYNRAVSSSNGEIDFVMEFTMEGFD